LPALNATETLTEVADRLAAFESSDATVVSLYLGTSAGERGRDHWQPFVRKALHEAGADAERIRAWLESELKPSANGAAVFACAGAGLFEAIQLEAAFPENSVQVDSEPQLYPLLRLLNQHPRFAALLTDTNHARLFAFNLGLPVETQTIESEKWNRTQQGGWSQQRYQRHVDDHYRQHAKAAVQALEQLVRTEQIPYVLLSGGEVILPLVKEELSQPLAAKVVDVLALEMRTSDSEVLAACKAGLQRGQANATASKVGQLVDLAAANGLAVTGLKETQKALARGQARELLITSQPAQLTGEPDPERRVRSAERLVKLARRSSADVSFVDEPALSPLGGVGAFLRYRGDPTQV
jgi:peptide chain release factor subunit 1